MLLQQSKSAYIWLLSGHTDISGIAKGSMLGQVSCQQLSQHDPPTELISLVSVLYLLHQERVYCFHS